MMNRKEFIKSLIFMSLGLPMIRKATNGDERSITLYVFDIRYIPIEHRYTILSAQGIFNRHMDETDEGIYCIWEHGRESYEGTTYKPESELWLRIYENKGLVSTNHIDLSTLIGLAKRFAEGYVIYDPRFVHSINVATTMAGVKSALIIHPEAENIVKGFGLRKIVDLRETMLPSVTNGRCMNCLTIAIKSK